LRTSIPSISPTIAVSSSVVRVIIDLLILKSLIDQLIHTNLINNPMPTTARHVIGHETGMFVISTIGLSTHMFVTTGLFVLDPTLVAIDTGVTVDIIQNTVKTAIIVKSQQFRMTGKVYLFLILTNIGRPETTASTRPGSIIATLVLRLTIEPTVKLLTEVLDHLVNVKLSVTHMIAVNVTKPSFDNIRPVVRSLIDDVIVSGGIIGILGTILRDPLVHSIQQIRYNLDIRIVPHLLHVPSATPTIVMGVLMLTDETILT